MRRSLIALVSILVLAGVSSADAVPGGGHGGGGGGGSNRVITVAVGTAAGVGENTAASATIVLTRTGNTKCPSNASWSTADGTATAPGDYTTSGATVSFARNQTSALVSVPLTNDATPEGPETFTITLTGASTTCKGATVALGNAVQTISIGDTDVVFTVNDGERVVLSDMSLGGCNGLDARLVASGAPLVLGTTAPECNNGVLPADREWTNTTGNPVTVTLALSDLDCHRTYTSDTLSHDNTLDVAGTANHAPVSTEGAGHWRVDLADAGAFCEFADEHRPPEPFGGNFSVDVVIEVAPVPSSGRVTLQPGEQASIEITLSGCNTMHAGIVTDLGDTTVLSITNETCSGTASEIVTNPGEEPLDVWLRLTDETCFSTYYSDSTGAANHASAFDTDPMVVDILDGGGTCDRATDEAIPATGDGNLQATMDVSATP